MGRAIAASWKSTDKDVPIAVYRRELTQVLERHARALPDASCVLLGPIDFPVGEPRLTQIIAVQRGAHGRGDRRRAVVVLRRRRLRR